MEKVLVLYNQVDENGESMCRGHLALESRAGCPRHSFLESRSGVMDQVNAVVDSLEKLDIEYEVIPVQDLRHLARILPIRKEKLIFNLMEEFDNSVNDACIVPALCESFGFGYTGNGTEALFLSLDKARAKAILLAAGLLCPAGISVQPGQSISLDNLKKGKYIIKPSCSDASEGIEVDSVVDVPSAASDARIKWIHEKFNQTAIVEQFIPSRELNVSIIETGDGIKVLPLAEIDFSAFSKKQLKLVDYQAKWIKDSFGYNNTPRIIPAPLDEPIAKKVRSLAIQAWDALGCHGYARVDFRLDEKDSPYVLEVNPNPDISPDAGFAAALAAAGIPYEQFVLMMLNRAAFRVQSSESKNTDHRTQNTVLETTRDGARGTNPEIRIAKPEDETVVLDIIERTGFFREVEIDIAREVFTEAAQKKSSCTYQSYIAEIQESNSEQRATSDERRILGWVCFGATPCTSGTFDIYWIAVEPELQRQGVGKFMLDFSEREIIKQGGRLAVVETSGMKRYESTQKFYEKNDYILAARIPDFYTPGDDKLIYIKTL